MNKKIRSCIYLWASLFFCGQHVANAQTFYYVDSAANGTNTGTSWVNAYKTVSQALATANNGTGSVQVWVAKGTYFPMVNTTTVATSRDSSFRILRNGIKLYGGFAGTETALSQRNIALNPTVLSGNIGVANDSTDNSKHVVTILAPAGGTFDTTTVLSGFTVSGGNAPAVSGSFTYNGLALRNADGGGVVCAANSGGSACNVLVERCILRNNNAGVGGGMYAGGYTGGVSSPVIRNCLFTQNTASDVAGIHCFSQGPTAQASPVISNCRFIGNNAASGGAIGVNDGGGAALGVTVQNCAFSANTASNRGGVVTIYGGIFRATNSVFTDNISPDGSIIFVPGNGTATFNNSTLYNAAATTSAALSNSGTLLLNNSILWGTNTAQTSGSGAYTYSNSNVIGVAAAGTNISTNPQFTNPSNPVGTDNLWGTTDDGLRLKQGAPSINTGSNALIPAGLTTDYAGAARVQETVVDQGAYEQLSIVCASGARLYVDSSKATSGAGTSWATAYKTVSEALFQGNYCSNINEIWVAKGTYLPQDFSGNASSRDSSFRILRNGIKLSSMAALPAQKQHSRKEIQL